MSKNRQSEFFKERAAVMIKNIQRSKPQAEFVDNLIRLISQGARPLCHTVDLTYLAQGQTGREIAAGGVLVSYLPGIDE